MPVQDKADYLGERIACEDRLAALARSAEARRIHAELAMHYRSELALLRAAGPTPLIGQHAGRVRAGR